MLYCCTKMTNVPDLELRYLCAMYKYNNTNRTKSKTKKKNQKTLFILPPPQKKITGKLLII